MIWYYIIEIITPDTDSGKKLQKNKHLSLTLRRIISRTLFQPSVCMIYLTFICFQSLKTVFFSFNDRERLNYWDVICYRQHRKRNAKYVTVSHKSTWIWSVIYNCYKEVCSTGEGSIGIQSEKGDQREHHSHDNFISLLLQREYSQTVQYIGWPMNRKF